MVFCVGSEEPCVKLTCLHLLEGYDTIVFFPTTRVFIYATEKPFVYEKETEQEMGMVNLCSNR